MNPRPAFAVDAILPGPTFNQPNGTLAQQLPILNKMMKAIDGVKSGSTIRMAFFSLTVGDFTNKLIAAHKRGVNVRLLQDDHEIGPLWLQLVTALGSDTTKRSWALVCHRSCMSDENPSYMHAKFYMFSRTHDVPNVVMVSSANPTYTQTRVGWNDLYTVTRDPTIYAGAKTYFEAMTAGAIQDRKTNQTEGIPVDAYFTTTSGKYKTYVFPIDGNTRLEDPMWLIMQNIKCTGAAYGYGSSGRTVVKVAMYQWSVLRIRLATRLWHLDDKGCSVDILYDPSMTDPGILAELKKPGGNYGGPTLTAARRDDNYDGTPDYYLHYKFFIVNGVYAGDTSSKVVFTGSANWTNTALHYGNEIMLKVTDNAAYGLYLTQYEKTRAWAKTLAKWAPPTPPPPTPTPRPTGTPRPPTPPPTVAPTVGPTTNPTPTSPPPTVAPTLTPTLEPTSPPETLPPEFLTSLNIPLLDAPSISSEYLFAAME